VKIGGARLLRFKKLLQRTFFWQSRIASAYHEFRRRDGARTQDRASVFAGDVRAILAMLAMRRGVIIGAAA
jgi:hypothetical protein